MSKSTLNVGTAANSGDGDPLRSAAQKIEANFVELYSEFGDGTDLSNGNTAGHVLVADGTKFVNVAVSGDATISSAGAVTIKTNVALAGSPTTTTQSASDNSTKVATTAYTDTAIANLVNSAPGTLDTLSELATALTSNDTDIANINTALSGKQATITGAATTIDTEDLTASRALVSNASGKVEVSAVTSTEVGYLDGVTSAIQTQLDAKIGTGAGAVGTSNIASNAATPAKLSLFDDNTAATSGHILVADGTDFINKAVTGDISIDSNGAVTIANTAVETAMVAGDAVTGAKIAADAVDSEHYVDGSIDTAHIANDNVTHDKLEDRYTAHVPITTSTSIAIDWSAGSVFKLSGALTGGTQITFSNFKVGQCIEICNLSGSQTVTLSAGGTGTDYFYKVGGDYDGSSTNLLQVVCLKDGGDDEFAYSVNSYASDETP